MRTRYSLLLRPDIPSRKSHIYSVLVSLIQLPSVPQDQITITGYEHKAIAARDAIQAIVDELEEMISEDITLDSRVHARIIGARGKGIRKIMDEYKVRGTNFQSQELMCPLF